MCNFCDIYKYNYESNMLMENSTCFAIMDKNPVNHGHMLIITKRHTETIFDLSPFEVEDMHMLLKNAKRHLDSSIYPDGYNIGYNCGEWAGQTVNHCCAHLIPRFAGDVPATNITRGIINFKSPLNNHKHKK